MGARKGSKGKKRATAAEKIKAVRDKRAAIRAWLERSRAEQGLPARITDPEGIRIVAALLRAGGS
jgi:hypothetical protein